MNRVEQIKSLYPELTTRKYNRNPRSVTGASIINNYLAPINIPENVNPLDYIFKNALIEIMRLENYNVKVDFMVQLNLLIQSCYNPDKARLVLFKSPKPGDMNYDINRTFNVINRDRYRTEEQYLYWLDFDEVCYVFANNTTYSISRVFLQSVFNLKPNQTFEQYFDLINLKYIKETTFNTGIAFFNMLCKETTNNMPERTSRELEILKSGIDLPLITNELFEINLMYRNGYFLQIKAYQFTNNTNEFGLTGLLSDLYLNNFTEEYIEIDKLTTLAILAYLVQEESRFIEEGEDLIYHILAFYPRMIKEDILQRNVNIKRKTYK